MLCVCTRARVRACVRAHARTHMSACAFRCVCVFARIVYWPAHRCADSLADSRGRRCAPAVCFTSTGALCIAATMRALPSMLLSSSLWMSVVSDAKMPSFSTALSSTGGAHGDDYASVSVTTPMQCTASWRCNGHGVRQHTRRVRALEFPMQHLPGARQPRCDARLRAHCVAQANPAKHIAKASATDKLTGGDALALHKREGVHARRPHENCARSQLRPDPPAALPVWALRVNGCPRMSP